MLGGKKRTFCFSARPLLDRQRKKKKEKKRNALLRAARALLTSAVYVGVCVLSVTAGLVFICNRYTSGRFFHMSFLFLIYNPFSLSFLSLFFSFPLFLSLR